MDLFKKAYYRSFQAAFHVGSRCLRWRRPILISGPGSVEKIPELLEREKAGKVMIVTGPTVGKRLGPSITAALDRAGAGWRPTPPWTQWTRSRSCI